MKSQTNPMRGALSLGTAGSIDYAFQFLLPLILVRCLTPDQFGHYRAFWLITNTALAFSTIGMPFSLFYFLARFEEKSKIFISNTLFFLCLTGGIAAIFFSGWNPLLPENTRNLPAPFWLVPAFVFFWTTGSLVDLLANTEGRVHAQAIWAIALSLSRFILVGGAAFFTQSIGAILVVLLVFSGLRAGALFVDIGMRYRPFQPKPDWELAKKQMSYAIPFGMAGLLYNLREQGDQWIAAAKFTMQEFACFSLAGVVGPVVGIVRLSISNALLPKMNVDQHLGEQKKTIDLNRVSNTYTAAFLIPILVFGFCFADEMLTLVYTEKFKDASFPLRIYICGLGSQLFLVNNLLISNAKGNAMLLISAVFLPISIAASWVGAVWIGMPGAAIGSSISQWGVNLAGLLYVKKMMNTKASSLVDFRWIIKYICMAALIGLLVVNLLDVGAISGSLTRVVIGGPLLAALSLVFCLIWPPKGE